MTTLRKLDRDRTRADFAAVTTLLDQLTDEDVMTRVGLEARRDELASAIEAFDVEETGGAASAALFFGGQPVVGARGIESEFGGSVLTTFQDLVAKSLADETGRLGQRGVVPNKAAARLHITNVVRGSFGFVLEEVEPQGQFVKSSLKSAVENASRLLNAVGVPDEEQFQSAVGAVDERVLATARSFFELIRSSGATFRLVVGDEDTRFGGDAIQRAVERAVSTKVEEAEEVLVGWLGGVLPKGHDFEFTVANPPSTIRGKVDWTFSAHDLAELNRRLVNVLSRAKVLVKRVRRREQIARELFTLLEIHAAEPDQPQNRADATSAG